MSTEVRKLDVCFTPELLHLYDFKNRIIVVIDILRATSTITVALAHGAEKIIPVPTMEDCYHYKKNGYIVAAEYMGQTVEGFEYGNSPFSFMNEHIKGKTIVMKTTNGTGALDMCRNAPIVILGSFLNQKAVLRFIRNETLDVLLLCAGWRGKFNLEDTLFAGSIASELMYDFFIENDATLASMHLYDMAKSDLSDFLKNSSHKRRLGKLNIERDVEYCLKKNKFNVIPILHEGVLINLSSLSKLEEVIKK